MYCCIGLKSIQVFYNLHKDWPILASYGLISSFPNNKA